MRTWQYSARLHILMAAIAWGAIPAMCQEAPTAQQSITPPILYEARITGVEGALADQVRAVSQTVKLAETSPPDTMGALERRAEADRDRLLDLLKSEGYYDAEIVVTVGTTVPEPDGVAMTPQSHSTLLNLTPEQPVPVTLAIETGLRYRIGSVQIFDGTDEDLGRKYGLIEAGLGLDPGNPAQSAPVLAAEMRIAAALAGAGFPGAAVTGHRVVIDEATKLMEITYRVALGPVARFGPAEIEGLTRLDQSYVLNRIRWRDGALFDRSLLDKTREDLTATGLFTSVIVEPTNPAGLINGDPVAIRIRLVERLPRTVAAGLAYNTTQGVGINVSLDHRNLFGGGEAIGAAIKAGQDQRSLSGTLRRPDLFTVHQDLVGTLSIDQQNVAAFRAFGGHAQLGLERQIDARTMVGYGVIAERARLSAAVPLGPYTLVGTPIFARMDTSNDLLNPTRGSRIGVTATPYLRALGADLTYVQARITASTYYRLGTDDTWVLAVRGAVGATIGGGIATIPRDHLFFSGGGGSVRGFGFQKAGPRDQASEPSGGRSQLETGLDLRIKLTDIIGLVPFFDAGAVYRSPLPTAGRVFFGTGIGLRYYSAVGPVRLDLATPLNPRRTGDSALQLYVSLGQAF